MQFDFGKNWLNFSQNALTPAKLAQAQQDFMRLFSGIELKGKTFVDIGFGQGLSLLLAKQEGAIVVGCEVNPTCQEALKQTLTYFPKIQLTDIPGVMGSILSEKTIKTLLKYPAHNQGFDIVHSWGVLHHTSDMKQAIKNAATLVEKNGHLIISIYNRHWTSPVWLLIKWLYCQSPSFLQQGLLYGFYPIIWLAKYLVTRENPTKMARGMDFYYNVVDWVGGYPYEYASKEEIVEYIQPLGFELVGFFAASVPTGCNEFIFKRKAISSGQKSAANKVAS